MSELVERVAKTLCLVEPDKLVPSMVVTESSFGFYATFNGPLEPAWKAHEAEARRVIKAMMEPTQDMLADSTVISGKDSEGYGISEGDAKEVWRSMIAAALSA
jgi:hypothetical protein